MRFQKQAGSADEQQALDNLLLIAAREPIPGQTKTRLGATIGMESAAVLYRAFLCDLAARFTPEPGAVDAYTLGWAFSPPSCDFQSALSAIHPAALQPSVRFVPQAGHDWGVRQTNLLRWGRDQGFTQTVLTASDSPQMSAATIDEAFAALRTHDVVLGRVLDGGYFLIGMRGFHDVLSGVPMSTASAADALVARAKAMDLTVAEVPAIFDVDTGADLALLELFLDQHSDAAPATARALAGLELVRDSPSCGSSPGDRVL